MGKSIAHDVKEQIKRFKETGKLPAEQDVTEACFLMKIYNRNSAITGEGLDETDWNPGLTVINSDGRRTAYVGPGLGTLAEPVKIESPEARALAERKADFLDALSEVQRKAFKLIVLGGMGQTQAAQVLGVSKQRISQIMVQIRQHAKNIIVEELAR